MQIDFASVEEAAELLAQLEQETRDRVAQQVQSLEKQRKELEVQKNAHQRALTTRQRQADRQSARVRRHREQLDQVIKAYEATRQQELGLLEQIGGVRRSQQQLEARKLDVLSRQTPRAPAELRGDARLLETLVHQVDPSTLEINPVDQMVSWCTKPVRLRDGFGGVFDRDFGRFSIVLERRVGDLAAGLQCTVTPLDSTLQYPHPHVSGTSACLGTAQEVLLESLRTGNYATAIATMTEFMEDYNHDNPYVRLTHFGLLNRWEHPICSSGQHLLSDCTCARCLTCLQFAGPTRHLQDCGSCSTCCVQHHTYSDEPNGLSGTHCVLKGF